MRQEVTKLRTERFDSMRREEPNVALSQHIDTLLSYNQNDLKRLDSLRDEQKDAVKYTIDNRKQRVEILMKKLELGVE